MRNLFYAIKSSKNALRMIILTSLFLCGVSGANAMLAANPITIYANSSTGDDLAGDGTSGNPYKTFTKAYDAASSDDTIDLTGVFDWTNGGETTSSTSGFTLAKNLTIQGQGADNTFVQANSSSTNNTDRRVFTIPNGTSVVIEDLTVRYGYLRNAGAGLYVEGNLTMDSCAVSYNITSAGEGGGIEVRDGYALIQNSQIDNNTAMYQGGGIHTSYYDNGTGKVDLVNSTVVYNQITYTVATIGGGGIAYRGSCGTITNSTIAHNNMADGTADGAGIYIYSRLNDTLYVKNSIIAGNLNGNATLDRGDYDIELNSTYGTYVDNGGNIVGKLPDNLSLAVGSFVDEHSYSPMDGTFDSAGLGSGSLYLNSLLSPNGSLNGTYTLAIANAGSIAVNNGNATNNNTMAIPATDQRELSRVGAVDIGAYEYGGTSNTAPALSSVSVSPDLLAGSGEITVTPSGQSDSDSDTLYFYCNEVGSPDANSNLCDEGNASYGSGSYGSMSCSYTASTGNENRTSYCRVYDGAAYSSEKSTSYTVDTTNPTVEAGTDRSEKTQFTQDATVTDSGSGVASYAWSKQSGPGTVTFGTASAEDTTILVSEDGTYIIRLVATDRAGNSNHDEFTLVWDSNAPAISDIVAEAEGDSAEINWETDEVADSKVEYGLTSSLGLDQSDATLEVDHDMNLSSLQSCATYYYKVTSKDDENNSASSEIKTFHTSGCAVSSVEEGKGGLIPTSGGFVSMDVEDGKVKLTALEDFLTQSVTIQINRLKAVSKPNNPAGLELAKDNFFEFLAILGNGNLYESDFDKPITLVISYNSDTEGMYEEKTLSLYKYVSGNWEKKDCTVNTANNTLTCNLNSFSTYGVFGEEVSEEEESYDVKVKKVEYDVTSNSITVRWKTDDNAKSKIRYGLSSTTMDTKKKDKKKEKKHEMTVKGLVPNTQYFFRVSSYRGDDKDSSKIHSIRTSDITVNSSTNGSIATSYPGNAKASVCSYVVKSGDSLWSIAKEVYTDPTAYPLIIEKNKAKYPGIASGKLSLGQELSFDCK